MARHTAESALWVSVLPEQNDISFEISLKDSGFSIAIIH
jgi:hypothetical protein